MFRILVSSPLFGLPGLASANTQATNERSANIVDCDSTQTEWIQTARNDALNITSWVLQAFDSGNQDLDEMLQTWFGANADRSYIQSVYQGMHSKLQSNEVPLRCFPNERRCTEPQISAFVFMDIDHSARTQTIKEPCHDVQFCQKAFSNGIKMFEERIAMGEGMPYRSLVGLLIHELSHIDAVSSSRKSECNHLRPFFHPNFCLTCILPATQTTLYLPMQPVFDLCVPSWFVKNRNLSRATSPPTSPPAANSSPHTTRNSLCTTPRTTRCSPLSLERSTSAATSNAGISTLRRKCRTASSRACSRRPLSWILMRFARCK
jgi:hypothetical protein